MTVSQKGIVLRKLHFSGAEVEPAELEFTHGLNLLYGASNTGKSFTAKVIDFMLGARDLPNIPERQPYDTALLSLELPESGTATIRRSLDGGPFEYVSGGLENFAKDGANVRPLSAKHDHSNTDNLSQFLLGELGFESVRVAVDENGKTRSLSFRDLSRYCIVDETSIQAELSPACSEQYQSKTIDRSVLRFLLTGKDDSSISQVTDRKTFKAATAGKLDMLDDMIGEIKAELEADFPDADQLVEQSERIKKTWEEAQREFQAAQESIHEQLIERRRLSEAISKYERRFAEIRIHIDRFDQLKDVYGSDIQRLEGIEEAGFLLALGSDKECPLCGASPKDQKHSHSVDELERTQKAAIVEIKKIQNQQHDLIKTVTALVEEADATEKELEKLSTQLKSTEQALEKLSPSADEKKKRVEDILLVREQVRKGLSLISQREKLEKQHEELTGLKPPTKADKPRLELQTKSTFEFAQIMSEVLREWQFPGKRHVAFDEQTYDFVIDGKHRKDNGKGVRAITHAAFKVAFLLYCRERDLPHPGFILLDTPLLTYRDPLKSKAGALSEDEKELTNTSLKDHFFEHLAKNAQLGQFVVIENVDLPEGIEKTANLEVFTNDLKIGRQGLL